MSMMDGKRLEDEAGRIATLRRYEILDTEPEGEFNDIVTLLKSIFGMDYAAVNLIDTDRQWMKAASGLEPMECQREDAFCNHTIRSFDAMAIEDATLDPRFESNPFVTGDANIRSYLGVPLTSPEGYNIGALCVFGTQPRHFTAADVEVLQRFSKVVMSQMELRLISRQDSLTGGLTRRAFIDRMDRAIAEGGPTALILLDVDHFKTVNDTFGHPAGDTVLNGVAKIIRAKLRRSDSLGRLGGDEFGILLPGADAQGALALAERMRGEVAALRFLDVAGAEGAGAEGAGAEGAGAEAEATPRSEAEPTLSMGIAPMKAGESREAWMERGDQALYAAKRGGRNRCVLLG